MFMSCCFTGLSAESTTKMSFTIIKNLEQLPSYPVLCKLAEQNQVRVDGNERTGSFSGHGMEGDYKFSDDGIHGKFAGHGVIRIAGGAGAQRGDLGEIQIIGRPLDRVGRGISRVVGPGEVDLAAGYGDCGEVAGGGRGCRGRRFE
jgi:hypothetical protein